MSAANQAKAPQSKRRVKKVDAEAVTTDSDGMGSPDDYIQQAREIEVDPLPDKKKR